MLRKRSEQPNHAEWKAAEKALRVQLTKKGAAALLSMTMLVAVGIAGTVAWYTRVAEVSGITMEAAKYDLRANYVTEHLVVYAADYLDTGTKAAPGVTGVIPVRISAESSDLDSRYSLGLDFSSMSNEFQRHICFYYYTKDGDNYVKHYLNPGDLYGEGNIKGTVAKGEGKEVYEYIYWTWVYELSNELYLNNEREWVSGGETPSDADNDENGIGDFDDFDARIGLGECDIQFTGQFPGELADTTVYADGYNGETKTCEPEPDGTKGKLYAYQKAMAVKLDIVGAQAKPDPTHEANASESQGGSVYRAIRQG